MIRARLSPGSVPERIVVDVVTDHEGESTLWWETVAGDPPPIPDRLDVAALALVSKAMNFRQDLHLEGPVSWRLLANLEEYMDAWTQWRPDIFGPVALTADEVVDDRGTGAGALADRGVLAFSGGVDGTYAAYAHARGLLGHRTLRLAAGVLVHGFDIPLEDAHGFELATAGARAMTDELGIPLVTMRTNWQAVADPEWQMTFGAAIAAVLHLFPDRAGNVILAADTTYAAPTFPWGSNPITNPLLASSRLRMVQPGAGATRTEKVRAIGGLASVREHLRVCWEGDEPGRNCERCEKCVRTKVNLLAAGHGAIPALGPLDPGELRGLTIGSTGARDLYLQLLGERDLLPADVVEDLRWLIDQPIAQAPAARAEPRSTAAPRRWFGRR
jgi:hypothetical protein